MAHPEIQPIIDAINKAPATSTHVVVGPDPKGVRVRAFPKDMAELIHSILGPPFAIYERSEFIRLIESLEE